DHRTAVIEDRSAQIDRRIVLHQVRVHGVAPREHPSRDENDVADLQRPDLRFGDRRLETDLAPRARHPLRELVWRQHRCRPRVAVAIEPRPDRARLRVERDAEPPERPAVVRDRHEEARGKAIQRTDFAADEGRPAAEPHGPDGELICGVHDRALDRTEARIRIRVVERAEQLLFRVQVPRRAIAADAHPDRTGTAALALRLPHRVENALLHAFESAIRAAEVIEIRGKRVLRVRILAAASLEDQLHFNLVVLPLLEVDDRRAGPEIVARVLAGDRIDGVRPQLAAPGRVRDRLADLRLHPDLVRAYGHLDLERRHAGVLTD